MSKQKKSWCQCAIRITSNLSNNLKKIRKKNYFLSSIDVVSKHDKGKELTLPHVKRHGAVWGENFERKTGNVVALLRLSSY